MLFVDTERILSTLVNMNGVRCVSAVRGDNVVIIVEPYAFESARTCLSDLAPDRADCAICFTMSVCPGSYVPSTYSYFRGSFSLRISHHVHTNGPAN